MTYIEIIGELLKFINNIFITPRKQIKKVISIYDSMHRVLDETAVERFLIVKAHNSGGIIKPNTPLYISVIYEDYTHPFKSIKDDYQKLSIDEEYLRMLVSLCNQKSVKILTKDLPKSLLKSIYEGEGVKYSELYYLGQDKKNIYFSSCATSVEGGWEDNSYQKMTIEIQMNTIRNNII
jgi:hypothetical protein